MKSPLNKSSHPPLIILTLITKHPFTSLYCSSKSIKSIYTALFTLMFFIKDFFIFIILHHLVVSWNRGTPNHPFYFRISHEINHLALGYPPWLWTPPNFTSSLPVFYQLNHLNHHILPVFYQYFTNFTSVLPVFFHFTS